VKTRRTTILHRPRLPGITVLLLITAIVSPTVAFAHGVTSTGVSWGMRSGICLAQHVGTEERDSEYEIDSDWRAGFTGAVFVYWPVTERFGLQQEVAYTQKGSTQRIGVEIIDIPTTLHVTYEVDYLEIPVLTRYTLFRNQRGEMYSLAGMAMSIMLASHYELSGEVSDGVDTIAVTASSDMSEVDLFDFSVVYGLGYDFEAAGHDVFVEYRFTMSWNTLYLPTYAYVPFGDEEILIDNEPVPLKNQTHSISFGVSF